MKRWGLRLKFAVVIVVLLALIFGAMAVILIRQDSKNLRNDLNTKSKLFASLATSPIGNSFLTYQDSGQIKITQQIQSFTDLNPEISNVAVVDTAGKLAFNQHNQQNVQISAQDAGSFEPVYYKSSSGIIQRIIVPLIEDNGSHRFNLVYFVSSAAVEATVHSTEMSILWFSILGLLISIVLTYLLTSRLFVVPIQKVSAQALAISLGNFNQEINAKSRDEVGDLAKAVNAMAESLKANIAKLQDADKLKSEFMMITSHNLRTPLTIINGYMETLKKYQVDLKLRHILDTIAVSGKRLEAFAEDMLTISQVESGADVIQKQPTEIASLLQSLANDFAVLAKQKNIIFSSNISTGQHQADISPAHLRSAMWNLLDNALKFTPNGGFIKLTAQVIDQKVQISVADSGIGIATEEIPKLFTKFHRGTDTWKYQYEGTGIGLYSTKLVIDRLGGSISVASQLDHGSTFTVQLPVLPDTPPQPPA